MIRRARHWSRPVDREVLRLRWERLESKACRSGDLDLLHVARNVLRRLGRVEERAS